MRVFIALNLEEKIINEITKIQNFIKKENEKKNFFNGKFTESHNLHLTLKFLGKISEVQANEIKKRLLKIKFKEFFSELGKIGIFSKDFVKIIWIELNGEGIFNLQEKIDEKLRDLFEKEERFMSHLTIARVKNASDKKGLVDYLKSIKPRKIKFRVKEFALKKSELFSDGPVYSDIERYGLDKEKTITLI